MANLSTATKAKNKKLSALRQKAKMKAGAADLQKKVKAAVAASTSKQNFKDYNPGTPMQFLDYNPKPMPLPKSKPKNPNKKESSGVIFDTTGTQPGKTIKRNKGGPILMSPRKLMACGGKVHK